MRLKEYYSKKAYRDIQQHVLDKLVDAMDTPKEGEGYWKDKDGIKHTISYTNWTKLDELILKIKRTIQGLIRWVKYVTTKVT